MLLAKQSNGASIDVGAVGQGDGGRDGGIEGLTSQGRWSWECGAQHCSDVGANTRIAHVHAGGDGVCKVLEVCVCLEVHVFAGGW